MHGYDEKPNGIKPLAEEHVIDDVVLIWEAPANAYGRRLIQLHAEILQ